jgi:CheY-like chemotaxis protein
MDIWGPVGCDGRRTPEGRPGDDAAIRRILVVDSNELICSLLCAILNGERTAVYCALTGEKAMTMLRQCGIDLCFLDLHLSSSGSRELMREIRKQSPCTRIIAMTGSEPDRDAMKAIREHAVLLLMKPFDLFVLEDLVEEILGKNIETYRDYAAMVAVLHGDNRQFDRRPFTGSDDYVLHVTETDYGDRGIQADTLDISQNGLGIRTTVPLEPGCVVRLNNGKETICGIVRWASLDMQDARYRAGIQFIPHPC